MHLHFCNAVRSRRISGKDRLNHILSTCLINWQALSTAMPFLKSYLQFPHRLLIIAYPLLEL